MRNQQRRHSVHIWLRLTVMLVGVMVALPWLPTALAIDELAQGSSGGTEAPTRADVFPRVEFGRRLFFDVKLSVNGAISCASCHQPERAFADGKPVAEGVGGRKGARNTPSLLHARDSRTFFWDGRRDTLENQVLDPLFNPNEHGLSGTDALLRSVRSDPEYEPLARQAFLLRLSEVKPSDIAAALAAYVRTLGVADSPVDRYLFDGDRNALSPAAVRGLTLFRGRAQCSTCHVISAHEATLMDHDYHSLSVNLPTTGRQMGLLVKQLASADRSERDRRVIAEPEVAALGRFVVTLDPRDIGKFKTPSLRNVARTAPYMHDGSVATLQAAVEREIYYRSRALGRPLILNPGERADLVAFLEALTSPLLQGR